MRMATATTTKGGRGRMVQQWRRRRRKIKRGRTRRNQRPPRLQRKIRRRRSPPPTLLGGINGPLPRASLEIILVRQCRIGWVHVLRMSRLHYSQSPMAGQNWGGWEERGGRTKATMMSSTSMGDTLFTFVLGIPEGPASWRPGRRRSTGGRRGWELFLYWKSPGIGRRRQS